MRLRPRDDEMQSCLSFRLTTRPAAGGSAHRDYFGNWVHRFNVLPEHRHLRIEAESVVLVQDTPPLRAMAQRSRSSTAPRRGCWTSYYDFLAPLALRAAAGRAPRAGRAPPRAKAAGRVAGFVRAAATLIHARFRYEKGATHVQSSVEDVLESGAGVCQDFAHLLLGDLACARAPGALRVRLPGAVRRRRRRRRASRK